MRINDSHVTIHPDFFKFSKKIDRLYLRLFSLKNFSSSALINLKSIEKLELTRDKLISLEPNSFRNLTTLSILHLRSINFQTFPKDIFQDLINLMEISISNSEINNFPEEIFVNNIYLWHFDIYRIKSKNKLTIHPNILLLALLNILVIHFFLILNLTNCVHSFLIIQYIISHVTSFHLNITLFYSPLLTFYSLLSLLAYSSITFDYISLF